GSLVTRSTMTLNSESSTALGLSRSAIHTPLRKPVRTTDSRRNAACRLRTLAQLLAHRGVEPVPHPRDLPTRGGPRDRHLDEAPPPLHADVVDDVEPRAARDGRQAVVDHRAAPAAPDDG